VAANYGTHTSNSARRSTAGARAAHAASTTAHGGRRSCNRRSAARSLLGASQHILQQHEQIE
jgi:hypothetical protein